MNKDSGFIHYIDARGFHGDYANAIEICMYTILYHSIIKGHHI